MLGPGQDFDPNSPNSPIRNNSISVFTPAFIFNSNVRDRRRNMLASLFLSVSLLAIMIYEPNLKLVSIFIMRFDQPLSSLKPITYLLSAHLVYCVISFLIELFSEMKRKAISFQDIGSKFSRNDSSRTNAESYFYQSESIELKAVGALFNRNLEHAGRRFIRLEHQVSIQISRLFLYDTNFIKSRVLKVEQLEFNPKQGATQLSNRQISDDEIPEDERWVIQSIRKTCTKEIMQAFRYYTFRRFVFWYEIFVPVIISLEIALILILVK